MKEIIRQREENKNDLMKRIKQSKLVINLRKIRIIENGFSVFKTVRLRFKSNFSKKIVLHGDRIFREMFKEIGKESKVDCIIETGTYMGYTTGYLSKNFPLIPIYTSEIDNKFFKKAKHNLRDFKNIKLYHGNSTEFIKLLIEKNILGKKPMFFLDAHWYLNWPLEKELEMIMEKINSAIIVIDDFKVPGKEEFGFYTCRDEECSLDRVLPHLNKNKKYNLLFPNYPREYAFKGEKEHDDDIIGYPIIFQNMENEFKKMLKNPFIKKYFVDRSKLLEAK